MRLNELSARGFRNLSPDPVFFGSGITVVAGDNAQGKTNLLEAVALVCGQRSFRRAHPAEMACDGQSFSVGARLANDRREEKIAVHWSREGGRRFERAGKPISFREVSALAPAVFFAPEHRDLILGSPATRRRFLDRLAFFCRPAAGDDLARYERALASRNALLLQSRQREPAEGELEAWTRELVSAGTAVRRYRRQALEEWRGLFAALAQKAGPEYAGIRVDYSSREESPEDFLDACRRLAQLERRRGHTLAGPHRDDLVWTRCGRPLSGQASAGEIHRTVGLVKLAEWHAVARATGEKPLFAVDEFDAGLAANRVERWLAELPGAETVLLTTASDPARYARRAGCVLEIRAGRAIGLPRAVNA